MYLKEKSWKLNKKNFCKKNQKPTFEQILATSVAKKEKGKPLKKKASVPKRNNTNFCNRNNNNILLYLK